MANIGGMFHGAAGGAGIGTAIAPGIGTAIGAGVGLLAGLGEDSPEEQRKKRKNELLQKIAEARQAELTRTATEIARQTQANASASKQGASRRAAAAGVADNEAYVLPAEDRALTAGTDAQKEAQMQINSFYDRQAMGAESDYANSPIEPGASEYLGELGGAALQYKQGQDMINAYSDAYGPQSGTDYNPNRANEMLANISGPPMQPLVATPKSPLGGSVGQVPLANLPDQTVVTNPFETDWNRYGGKSPMAMSEVLSPRWKKLLNGRVDAHAGVR